MAAVIAFADGPNGGLIVPASARGLIHRDLIISLAARHRLPAIYAYRTHVASGGLISYGIDSDDQFRRAAGYVDRILKGEKPADLPVQNPTKYELAINIKTAKALDRRQHWLAAFRRGLAAEGFVEGQNVTLEYRSADGRAESLPDLAAELVRRPQVAVIFASGPPAALAAKRATGTIPIVFVSGGDPVQMGLVSSFHRPDGNVTGFYFLGAELVAKRLALLHELLPGAKRVAVLINPTTAATAEPTARGI